MSASSEKYGNQELILASLPSEDSQTSSPVKLITIGLLAMMAMQYRERMSCRMGHRSAHGHRSGADKASSRGTPRNDSRSGKKMNSEQAMASESALGEELLHAYRVRDCSGTLSLLKSLRGKQSPGTIARLLKPWGRVDPDWVVDVTLAAQGQVRHLVNAMVSSMDTAGLPGSLQLRQKAASAVLEGCVPVGRDLRSWLQYFQLRGNSQSTHECSDDCADDATDDAVEASQPVLENEILEAWILGMMASHDKSKAREAAQALSITELGDKWIPEEQLHEFMDRLLGQGRTDDVSRLFKADNFPRIRQLLIEGMEQRGLIKQAVKAMQSFGMTEEDFPSVAEAHYRKKIRWCISSGDVDLESYIGTEELEGRPSLQQFWCEQLIDVGHTWLAIAFYRAFPENDIERWEDGMDSIKEQIEELQKDAIQLEAQYEAENAKFFQREEEDHLSLGEAFGVCDRGRLQNSVHVITTVGELQKLINRWEAERSIIGLDSEWSAFRLVLDSTCDATDLVQLATPHDVYLVDIYHGEHGLLNEIGRLVESKAIIVVGFGIAGDLRVLRNSGMGADGDKGGITPHRIVDLNNLVDSYLPPRKGASKHQRGLTEVVKYFLGKPLSKVMRMSNWRKRPLSPRQVEYASLDALVLLKCIEKIKNSIDPDLDLWDANVTRRRRAPISNTVTPRASRASAGERDVEEEASCNSDNSSSLRREHRENTSSSYHNDGSLEKQSNLPPALDEEEDEEKARPWNIRKLRGLGVDTLELDSCEPAPLEYIAETQHRAVVVNYRTKISKRRWCKGVKCYVLPELCNTIDQQLSAVMQEFAVEVDPDSLLGRCVSCNARDWIITTDKDMVKGQVHPMTLKLYNKFYVCGGCGKVYWEGVMFEKAVTHLRKFVNHDRLDQPVSESDESSDETSDERTRWARALRDGTIDSTQARKLHDRMVSEKLTEDLVHDPREKKTLECIAERNKASSKYHICVPRLAMLTYFATVIYSYMRRD
ncbi:Exonuclease mut-7 [Perkinsus olseni]|uniref:Exonuclease mut-7 n=1 Tax=Perkinsus olseni TaxID=32597 RepID=A0A7J6LK15_PEROL|nr:Exonuclease mut-7 [Perkinsus olseni]KAF4663870.1 Exonuclease mut-7 [Perkinsus olseni]